MNKADLEESYSAYSDIFGPVESFQVDDIVDPNETRGRIIRVLDAVRANPGAVGYKHGIMP